MTRLFRAAAGLALTLLFTSGGLPLAKAQAPKTYSSAEILLGLQKLNVVGSVLYIAAHPDDENTRLLAYLANERKVETAYLSLTRGDGGQDLIGPELREQLGVIRTQELLAARRLDGAQQFFTRANDFGFSKTAEEALRVWDHEQVLADVVWVIRQRRPDVLITRFPPDARAGHGHHQASAILAAEAFDAAADPKRFPEQLQYVQPWQAKRLLWNTGSFFVKPGENMDGYLKLDAGGYNPLLGQSYGEIAARSRSQHRSQGFGSAAQRGEAIEYFQLVKGAPATKDILEGVDLTWNRVPGGAAIGKMVADVIRKYDAGNPSASVAGLQVVEAALAGLPPNDKDNPVESAAHYSFWQQEKQEELRGLVLACQGIYIDATTSVSSVTPGQRLPIDIEIANRSPRPVELMAVGPFMLSDADKDATGATRQVINPGQVAKITTGVTISAAVGPSQPYWLQLRGSVGMYVVPKELMVAQRYVGAKPTYGGTGDWIRPSQQELIGKPENPNPVPVIVFGQGVKAIVGVQYKHTDPVLGELYQPLAVVPPVLVNIPAARAYVFADQQPKTVPVTVRAGQAGVSGTLALQVPAGWQVEPAAVPFDLKNKDEEQTVTFQLRPGAGVAEGKAELRAVATVGGQAYSRGIQTIQYPHIPTQTLFPEAVAPLVRLRVARGHTRTVGYLMGAGDEVPEALRQLGYTVSLLDPATDLTTERLAKYDAVVLGVRAYNVLDRLKTQQPQLLKYVENGGTLLVQYVVNRGTVIPQIGPYPLTLSADRVTVENTPVTFLKPAVPVLSEPNQLTPADFATGWVQEQGLYYPSAWDSHYQPVIASHDPGETDKASAILVAPYGKGRYLYTGLSLFRELPVGVPGAYRILANLVESNAK